MTFKNIFQIYTLLVCFISIIILIFSIALSLNKLTELIIPQYTYYSSLRHYDSNATYIRHYEKMWGESSQNFIALEQLSPPQLDEKRAQEKKEFLEDKKSYAFETLIYPLQWAFVAFIFFFIHWRLYKKSKE